MWETSRCNLNLKWTYLVKQVKCLLVFCYLLFAQLIRHSGKKKHPLWRNGALFESAFKASKLTGMFPAISIFRLMFLNQWPILATKATDLINIDSHMIEALVWANWAPENLAPANWAPRRFGGKLGPSLLGPSLPSAVFFEKNANAVLNPACRFDKTWHLYILQKVFLRACKY